MYKLETNVHFSFHRALQPISEQGENTKDDLSKVEESNTPLTSNDHSKIKEVNEQESINANSEHVLNSYNEDNNYSIEETENLKSKEDYSACIKLIEKFQEAVLDNAVRIIQVAFKCFQERQRFLKLRKAATIIQRNVRHWLKRRHLSETAERCLATKEAGEWKTETYKKCSSSVQERDIVDWIDDHSESEGSQNVHEGSKGVSDELCSHEALIQGTCSNLFDSALSKADQFESSFDSLDDSSLSGSTDNISDAGVCIDQGENNATVSDPDALSLADSGIDMCSDAPVEVCTAVDDFKCSTTDSLLPNSSTLKTVSENSSDIL